MRGSRAGRVPGRPARSSRSWHPLAADLGAVAAGGAVGSVARYLVELAVPTIRGFPWPTFTVNVAGSFALGFIMIYLLDVWPPRRGVRLFLTTGMLGGFTTFSSFTTDVTLQIHAGRWLLADAYALSSLVTGLAAVWCGVMAARLITRQRAADSADSYPDDPDQQPWPDELSADGPASAGQVTADPPATAPPATAPPATAPPATDLAATNPRPGEQTTSAGGNQAPPGPSHSSQDANRDNLSGSSECRAGRRGTDSSDAGRRASLSQEATPG